MTTARLFMLSQGVDIISTFCVFFRWLMIACFLLSLLLLFFCQLPLYLWLNSPMLISILTVQIVHVVKPAAWGLEVISHFSWSLLGFPFLETFLSRSLSSSASCSPDQLQTCPQGRGPPFTVIQEFPSSFSSVAAPIFWISCLPLSWFIPHFVGAYSLRMSEKGYIGIKYFEILYENVCILSSYLRGPFVGNTWE